MLLYFHTKDTNKPGIIQTFCAIMIIYTYGGRFILNNFPGKMGGYFREFPKYVLKEVGEMFARLKPNRD